MRRADAQGWTRLALEYDLHCTFCADFQQIFSEERQDAHFAELLTRMKVVDAQGDTEMNMDQWEAASAFPSIFNCANKC